MMNRIRSRTGFTLVELMIVVAIIGILAAIAIPNFLNFRLKAKTSEAKSNLGAIRSTEVAYVAEWNSYIGGQTTIVPVSPRAGSPGKVAWAPNGAASRFSILGFAPEGQVFYSYGLDGSLNPTVTEGFTAHAISDLDGDNATSDYYITNASTDIQRTGAPF